MLGGIGSRKRKPRARERVREIGCEQKAARLVVDLAASAGASKFTRCQHAHVSGVSVITGGHGLRRFLSDLSGDPEGVVSIPTTLNSAGCDREQMEEMGIDYEKAWAEFEAQADRIKSGEIDYISWEEADA